MKVQTAFLTFACIGILATAAFGQGTTGSDPMGNQQTGAGSSGMGSGSSGLGSDTSGMGNESGMGSSQGTQSITGEILSVQGDMYTVKDQSGKEVQLHVDESTQKPAQLQEGDKIEAQITPDGHALKVEKADESMR